MTPLWLAKLPPDLVGKVFDYLDGDSAGNLRLTCRSGRDLVHIHYKPFRGITPTKRNKLWTVRLRVSPWLHCN
jgi:hypothetical protein